MHISTVHHGGVGTGLGEAASARSQMERAGYICAQEGRDTESTQTHLLMAISLSQRWEVHADRGKAATARNPVNSAG